MTYENADNSRGIAKINVRWFFAVHKKDEEKSRELLSKTKYEYTIGYDESFPNFFKIYCR